MGGIEGRRMLVVGASSGIGRAIGQRALAAGADVAFAARRVERLEEAVTSAGRGHAVRIDVRDPATIERGVAEAVAALGGLDIVMYAAGLSPLAPVVRATAEMWREVLETNVVGAALTVRETVGHLAGHGIAAFCSSIDVERTRSGLVLYGASKCALNNMVEVARVEHPDVRFLNLLVGPTQPTEFGDRFDPELAGQLFGEWLAQGFMTRNIMNTDELADAVVSLFEVLAANPSVDVRQVRLDPVGGLMTLPATPEAIAAAFAASMEAAGVVPPAD
jgi:NAD(P)-dependent dehydrogenase (short-subunit alcohol dehydrogenase family)